jgi:hypothetical protein
MRRRTIWILAKPGETRFFCQPREYSQEWLDIQRKDGYELFEVTITLPERYDSKAEKAYVRRVKEIIDGSQGTSTK